MTVVSLGGVINESQRKQKENYGKHEVSIEIKFPPVSLKSLLKDLGEILPRKSQISN